MKKILVLMAIIIGTNGMAQGTQFGIGVSPGFKIISTKQAGTGLRSFQRGYGFSAGLPVKIWINEFSAFNTGVDFEFAAFDSFLNGQLVSSFRITGLHLPLMIQYHLSGNFYAMFGGGLGYSFSVRDLNVNQGADLTGVSNRFQPNIGVGATSLMQKDFGSLELGILGRYQPISIWKKDYAPFFGYRQRLITLEFLLRYYF